MNATARLLPTLLLAVLLVPACRETPAPGPDALAEYAARHAQAREVVQERRASGRVRVTVVDGADVPDLDDGPGGTDPYVVLEHDGQRFETSVAEDDEAPVWGDSFILVARPGAALVVTLMDEDATTDERVGVVSEPLPLLAPGEETELTIGFGGAGGRVRLRLEGLEAP